MMISRKHLPRRTFRQGMGTAIALPFLDSMVPAVARAASVSEAAAPLRMGFVYVPNGMRMPDWTPDSEGPMYPMTRILRPLEPFRHEMLVASGTQHYMAYGNADGGGDHARAAATFLTGTQAKKTGGMDVRLGTSVDQVAAQVIGRKTRFPSLQLGLEDNRTTGHCDSGYSCSYANSISWASPTRPLPPEISPRRVFERMFGDDDPNLDQETLARRAAYRRSILDSTLGEARRLSQSLGPVDRGKLDEYLYTIREVELRITRAERDERDVNPTIAKPTGAPPVFAEHAKLMYDLQAIAFQADLTRIVSFVVGREGSVRTYPEVGAPNPHHPTTHYGSNTQMMEEVARVNVFHVELFSYFLKKLKSIPEGDGTLLDHSMIVYGSAISDGNRHTHDDLPIVLAGRGNGTIRTGRHVRYPGDPPLNNLFMAMLDRVGVHNMLVGDATGPLEI